MRNILLTISYDGTVYSGFQLQANAPTVQEFIERALQLIYKKPVRINGAGRTDAGVHARGQTANYEAPFFIAPQKIPHALNAILPGDIVVTEAEPAQSGFHARFDALRKVYSYTIDRAAFPQVLIHRYSWHLPANLVMDNIHQACSLFTGTHDFRAFQAGGNYVKSTVRTLYRVEAREDEPSALLILVFEGNGFLYRMVRMITGTIIRMGRGNLTPDQVHEALHGGHPAAAGPTAPAQGLCLEKVIY